MSTTQRHSCFEGYHDLNTLLESYLDELDSWQREVDNIRIMHHEVWKGSRLSPLIKQHRAGSRVEKQTRILPTGGQTDVDYMFEVIGIEIRCDGNQECIYFKSSHCEKPDTSKSDMCNAYGRIYVSQSYKSALQCNDKYRKIFAEALSFDNDEGAFLLIPAKFKENVVQHCGLDYRRNEALSSTISPSISGQGALNEYDGVPCLKLSSWPQVAIKWRERQSGSDVLFDRAWKSKIIQSIPLFLVPAGNPMAEDHHTQFRLSFSMVEIACFDRLISPMRKMFGIVKYVFKAMFPQNNLLSSYHIKTLMLWKIDLMALENWKFMKTTEFIKDMMEEIRLALHDGNIPHFFVEDCNIFPIHKASDQNVLDCINVFQNLPVKLEESVGMLLRQDLNSPAEEVWTNVALLKLRELHEIGPGAYIAGYLTRLLSVITFSLTENYVKSRELGEESFEEMKRLFAKYEDDHHVGRIVHMVNSNVRRLDPNNSRLIRSPDNSYLVMDKMSRLAHEAFEAYSEGNVVLARNYIRRADSLRQSTNTVDGIGISVTKFHKCLHNDKPIQNVIQFLEMENNGRCPRFYLAPSLLTQHLKIQLEISSLLSNVNALQLEINKLHIIVESLSYKEPYLGRLSYKFAGVYLLKGYDRFVRDQKLTVLVPIPFHVFNQRRFAKNFNLR